MSNNAIRIPVTNSSRRRRVVILEPLAEPVELGPGESVELIYRPRDGHEWDFELEIHEDDSLLLYSMAEVEVWRQGKREL